MKENPQYATLLSYYDSSSGVNPIICKLPQPLQNKWVSQAAKKYYSVLFPPFSFLVDFIRETSSMKNDPAFQFDGLSLSTASLEKRTTERKRAIGSLPVHTRKTDLTTDFLKISQKSHQDAPYTRLVIPLTTAEPLESNLYKKEKISYDRWTCATNAVNQNICQETVKLQ